MLASKKIINGTDEAKLCKLPVLNWYVIYTKPRSEKKVYERLIQGGIEAFCPIQKVRRIWTDRNVTIEEPVFKSYCFVRVYDDKLYLVREIYGVVNFVYWLRKPAIVRDVEIETLQNLLSKHSIKAVSTIVLKVGDNVKVKSGTFYKQQAVVQKIFKNTITVELKALNLKISFDKTNVEL